MKDEMDLVMEKEGYEVAILEGADVTLYIPKGAYMVHANYTVFTKEPFSSSWSKNETEHDGLRRVFFRSNRVENGYIVFTCNKDHDR